MSRHVEEVNPCYQMPKGHLSFTLIGKALKYYHDKLVKPQIAPSQGQQTQNTDKAHSPTKVSISSWPFYSDV